MILLKKIRLVNWYAFTDVTAPIGFFTLIAGKNGNGKSAMLDAIRYAAYGDTIFNRSSEGKGSRTVSSYTRGLLDATAGTYMRPADKVPKVYTHVVLEYYDEIEDKPFLLGIVIETDSANNCQTYRYVADRRTLDDMAHTYEKDGAKLPYSAAGLQKQYKLTLLNREQGLPRFMQMTGLKLNLSQMPVYLRKLRGIMSYDPDARIDRFIRESVLEERNVDFTKLIEAKNYIEQLNRTLQAVQTEIEELDGILKLYDTCENEKNRLLADDIKRCYKRLRELREEIERLCNGKAQAEQSRDDTRLELEILDRRQTDLSERLIRARVSLNQLDGARMIEEEQQRLEGLRREKEELSSKCGELELFQRKVSEILHEFAMEGRTVDQKAVLASLCDPDRGMADKKSAAEALRRTVEAAYEEQVEKLAVSRQTLGDIDHKLELQTANMEKWRKHKNTYDEIPDHVGLRNEINREFERRHIASEAKFASEYVLSLSDESWRDAIEAFLGARRYSILVEPQYYDIADDVLNRSQYRYAHLFNTRLLMKKKTEPEKDSVVHMLEIKNPVARKYFEYQLGRMHAVPLEEVRDHENAISKEGRVAVAMDGYFLRFDRIRSYYLGQQIYELNRRRSEAEIERLKAERKDCLESRQRLEQRKNRLGEDRTFFREYDLDAHRKYQKAAADLAASEKQIRRLEKALKNNREFIELSQVVDGLLNEQSAVKKEQAEKAGRISELETTIHVCENKRADRAAQLEKEESQYKEYEISAYTVVQRAVDAYEKYLEAGEQGPGGLLAAETRDRIDRSIRQAGKELMGAQAAYIGRHPGNDFSIGEEGRQVYAVRRERIWMDDLQEIRQKLDEQTRRYEDIFKNEFVLNIRKYCENAKADLKQINGELAKLNFSAKYQFDVHYVRDGSDYARIIEFADYLDERERLGTSEGQMTFGMLTSRSDEEGEQLEKDMKRIVNRIIETNSEEMIARFADYRNYMTYEILISNQIMDRAKLSRQTGFNSGAEVQIPYLLILASALLLIYNQRVNSTRLVFIDEPFAKMDPGNVKRMLAFLKEQKLQVIFCSPDKTESIGSECDVILPVLRVRPDSMQLGIVKFHEEKAYGGI